MDLHILTYLFPAITLVGLVLFFYRFYHSMRPRRGTTEWIERSLTAPKFSFSPGRYPMEKSDALPIIVILLVFGALAFYALGDTEAPQTFREFKDSDNTATIVLSQETEVSKLMYYTGLFEGNYSLQFSLDGVNWMEQIPHGENKAAMEQPHSKLFVWRIADLNNDNGTIKYIRISTSSPRIELGEIAVYDVHSEMIPRSMLETADALELVDEQDIVPDAPYYMNSMYFDEIYHGRTAFETLRNITPYEWTHPPLGKEIISVGVAIFGMTPFGWRFMGTLFGVIMLAVLYIFAKNLFGKTIVASCTTLLFGFDFMRFVQTRIATIDTYGVFFILLSYFFMYRYISESADATLGDKLSSLFYSGLFFGIGCASKWVVIYAGAGLAVIYAIHLAMTAVVFKDTYRDDFGAYLIKTLLFSVLCFIIVPAVIYVLSYIPYGTAKGMTIKDGMLWDIDYYKIVLKNQTDMFHYHSTLTSDHVFGSRWYKWVTDLRPILYYRDKSMGHNLMSSFAAFGNPVVWWGGFMAFVSMVVLFIRRRDAKALFFVIGYLSQLLPWVFIPRVVFIYHYFPSTLFLILSLGYIMKLMLDRDGARALRPVIMLTAGAGVLFAAFYPVLTGIIVPQKYTKYFLEWFPGLWDIS